MVFNCPCHPGNKNSAEARPQSLPHHVLHRSSLSHWQQQGWTSHTAVRVAHRSGMAGSVASLSVTVFVSPEVTFLKTVVCYQAGACKINIVNAVLEKVCLCVVWPRDTELARSTKPLLAYRLNRGDLMSHLKVESQAP